MALTIETGSIVTGADSWASRASYIAYAAGLGITIPNTEEADAQLRAAAIFIGTYESRIRGERVSRDQPLAFPRKGLVIEGFSWSDTEIPRQVLLCQMSLALDINAGIDLYNPPASASTPVRRERVEGAVEVEYAVRDAQKLSRNSTSRALLNSLLKDGGLTVINLLRA
jgi:hypothetical protein